MLCKKKRKKNALEGALQGTGDRETLIHLLIYSNELAYLQLIGVLVYRNSSPKSHEYDYLNFQQKL